MKTDTILELIRMLSAQGATGNLQINTGTTDGAVSFDRGHIVDAHLGKLTGFQAINALASLPDATYSYDQATTSPLESRITPHERMLLRDFFGIEAGEPEQSSNVPLESWPDEDPTPVVPLSSLTEDPGSNDFVSEDDREATLVRRKTADAEAPPPLTAPTKYQIICWTGSRRSSFSDRCRCGRRNARTAIPQA